VALVAGAFIGAACCGREQGWIIGPIQGALVAAVLFFMWRADRRVG
jgi:hypothetical protein